MSIAELLARHKNDTTTFVDCLFDVYKQPYKKRFNKEYNHVTNLINGNIDAHWEMIKSGQADDLNFTASRNLIFERGEAFHKVIKEKLINLYPGQVVGNWEHKKTGKIKLIVDPDEIGFYDYHELALKSDKYKVVGHADFFYLDPKTGLLIPLEIKSIDLKGFLALKKPRKSHHKQVSFYGELALVDEELNNNLHFKGIGNAVILYVCTDYIQASPFKSFSIEPNLALSNEIKGLLQANLDSYERIIEGKCE